MLIDQEQTARKTLKPGASKEDALAQRLQIARTISAISARLVRSGDLNAHLNDSLAEVGTLLGADRAYVFHFRESGALMDNTHEWCAQGVTPQIAELQGLQSDTFDPIMKMVKQGEAFLIGDVSALPAEAESERSTLKAQGIRSLLIMPMGLPGRPTGFVGFDNVSEAVDWQQEEIDLLRVVFQLLMDALEQQHSCRAPELDTQRQNGIVKSESLYRHILESLPAIFYRFSSSRGASYWSPQVEEILGFTQRDLIENPFLWHNAIHKDDLPKVDAAITAFEVGQRIDLIYRIRDIDGSWHWFQDRSIGRQNLEGEVVIEGLALDITAQKHAELALQESEQRYRGVVEDTPVLICSFLVGGEITFVNEAYCRYFEKPSEELLGTSFLTLIPEEDREIVMRNISSLTIDSPSQSHEHRAITPEGEICWQHWINRAIFDNEGNAIAYQAIGEDITERIKAQAAQTRLQRELQQSQKMEALGQLTGGIAHDFNNLLGIIMGYAGFARDRCVTKQDAKQAKYLEHVLKASKRARDLVTQMLAFSRNEAPNKKPLQLQPLVNENLKMVRSMLPASIGIKDDIEENLPIVLVDSVQLNQLLMNLCVNARDAMEGKGNITIHLGRFKGKPECASCHKQVVGDWVELSITDTAGGIRPEVLSRIFDPFFTTKEVGKGTGMGLSVIHNIMHNHGGHILVETELDKGTTFRLLFPSVLEKATETLAAGQSPKDVPHGEGEHILVLDDEPDLANFLGDLLESHGYRATVLTSSTKALELFEEKPYEFALVITDQTMPKLTGVELVKDLRKIRPDMPVILNSGFNDYVDAKSADKMGICYLEKPVRTKSLIEIVWKLLKQAV